MDVQNRKMALGITALAITSMATLTLAHASALEISIGTTTLLILPWLFMRKRPLIGYKVVVQSAYTQQQARSSAQPVPDRSSPIKHYDKELNALVDLALAHVLRNAAKMKEACKTEQKHLYEMQQTVNSRQLASLKQYDLSLGTHLIDERLNYLDYHADKMILLIGKFSGTSIKLETIANQAYIAPSDVQAKAIKSLQTETLHLDKLLNKQLSEFAGFNKDYRHDTFSRIIERCGTHLQTVLQTIRADSDTLLNIIQAATCIRSDIPIAKA